MTTGDVFGRWPRSVSRARSRVETRGRRRASQRAVRIGRFGVMDEEEENSHNLLRVAVDDVLRVTADDFDAHLTLHKGQGDVDVVDFGHSPLGLLGIALDGLARENLE